MYYVQFLEKNIIKKVLFYQVIIVLYLSNSRSRIFFLFLTLTLREGIPESLAIKETT
jgi:hypothetical protein